MKIYKNAIFVRWLWVVALSVATAGRVAAQPRITGLTLATNGTARIYHVTAQVTTGVNHRLQASTNLATKSWIDVGSATATSSSLSLNLTNAISTEPAYRYFRLAAGSPPVVPVNMTLIPAGGFDMGDPFNDAPDSAGQRPVHLVSVSAFYIDQYEVTKALWDDVKAWGDGHGYGFDLPGVGKAPNHPVQTLSWFNVVLWCNARSEKEGRVPAYYTDKDLTQVYKTGHIAPFVKWAAGYRLPTEAEWEKAARGGARGHRFPWADTNTISHSQANYFSRVTDLYDNSPTRGYHPTYTVGVIPYTSPVGSFAANGYGLFDMAGNVYEWCWDWAGSYSSDPQTDPRGPDSGFYRIARGGGWNSSGYSCRSADRSLNFPESGPNYIGFRSVLPPGPP